MSITHIFREYDIRGIYEDDLNEQSIKTIGYLLGKRIISTCKSIVIGYDARTHSPVIARWLISGLNYAGLSVKMMGLVPTPCNYFAGFYDHADKADASIMITGSHNPPEYNGLKITVNQLPFFGKDITALGNAVEKELDVLNIPNDFTCKEVNTLDLYAEYLIDHFKDLKDLPHKMVIDCGNGVAGTVLPKLCEALNLNAEILYPEPDGTFPNHHPDPTVEENIKDIKERLATGNYDVGFAYDGDADRIAVLTKINNIKGDQLALLYAKLLKEPKILGEVKCSQVMYDEINKTGLATMYKTGHSNIKTKMKELDIDIAAEVSGHIFFADRYFGYDDAIYAMMRTLELLKAEIDLDAELAKLPKTYSTEELKIKTTETEKFEIVDKLKEFLANPPKDFPNIKDIITVDGVRVNFDEGWGLIRASNTTPVLVARFEAINENAMNLYQIKMYEAVKECQG